MSNATLRTLDPKTGGRRRIAIVGSGISGLTSAHLLAPGNDITVFMGASGEPPGPRTVDTNHSDFNVLAARKGGAHLRHHWNPNNTLTQWQERFGEDKNSRVVAVRHRLEGSGFALLETDGLDVAGPIPAKAGWTARSPGRVGCERTVWPE